MVRIKSDADYFFYQCHVNALIVIHGDLKGFRLGLDDRGRLCRCGCVSASPLIVLLQQFCRVIPTHVIEMPLFFLNFQGSQFSNNLNFLKRIFLTLMYLWSVVVWLLAPPPEGSLENVPSGREAASRSYE